MSFVSSEYAILLVLTLAACAALSGRGITWALLTASVVFYGWWNPPYLVLLAAVIVISWAGALALERWRRPEVLALVVGGELALLVYFKYAGFLAANLQAVAARLGRPAAFPIGHVLLPAGISFMTFQGVAYAVDVYRGEFPAERSLVSVALFKSFFPQLVAGPIERASHLMPQLKRLERDGLAHADLARGTFMILKGVVLKFVVADNLSVIVDQVYGNVPAASPLDVALAVGAFSIQIYGDFYGYTCIARGSAALLGVDLVPNFAHPYLAGDIQEFWRRWHISLSRWFRDYLYIPLGGSRVGPFRTAINLVVVMLAVGLWHGASWTFVVWGAVHGALLAGHLAWRWLRPSLAAPSLGGTVAGWAATIVAVTLAWVPFRSPDLHTPLVVMSKLAEWLRHPAVYGSAVYQLPFYVAVAGGFVLLECLDATVDLDRGFVALPPALQGAAVLMLAAATYLGPAKDVAFLYFQF